jgi:hypothetical protein
MDGMPFAGVNQGVEARKPPRFGIPSHIHVCVTSVGAVILDISRDKYVGLGRNDTELLSLAVPGWPTPVWQTHASSDDEPERLDALARLCEALAADGILERIEEGGEPRVVAALRDMRRNWISIGDELEVRGRPTVRHILRFVAAYLWARYSLAWRPFASIVEEVEMDKLRDVRSAEEWQPDAVAALVDVFRRLRPFAFAAENRCLLHALTLMKFVGPYHFRPTWMIGVTTQPWGAHSWVEWGDFLLDSNPEKVCGYTPIMAV